MKNNGPQSVQLLHSGAVKAIKKAVAKAIAEHQSAGVPAAIWRDGKVVHLFGHKPKGRRG